MEDKYADMMELGSEGSAAGGGGSDPSEWQRSIKSRESVSPKILSGTATGRHSFNEIKCGYDGIGRRVGFRFLCQWRVGSSPTIRTKESRLFDAVCVETIEIFMAF